ncbi:hypothetical protein ASD8599_02547 [Ascidiaceihabitans donghaensis]|uniref:Beta-lactamase n=1 Tax=Ascidiaceihabitans donghaensis TaxID=1510460 RepID=A0A2R8BFD6_9RHOB|nr:hypothetical protein [Ascidiaceihabitans donghaensis]SPH21798.1 hypothetical protein ASD8599_02547 [Ascidiaceihabitans donghaensis]
MDKLKVLGFAVVFAALNTAFPVIAQEAYKNTCDPAHYTVCIDLSEKYENGYAPFPQDPDRAETLRESVLSYARANCGNGKGKTCSVLSKHFYKLSFSEKTPPEEYLAQLVTIRMLAKTGCAAGDPEACFFLSANTSRDYRNLRLQALMIETRGRDDQSDQLHDLRTTLDAETDMWYAQTKTHAQSIFDALHPNCSPAAPEICGAMADAARYLEHTEPTRLALYDQACFGGAPQFCEGLGNQLFSILNEVDADTKAQTAARLETACADGLAEACAALLPAIPLFPIENFSAAATPFQTRACTSGHTKSCGALGRRVFKAYLKSENTADLQNARNYLESGCAGDDVSACHMLEHLSKG